jgi:hypothetical protein
VLRSCSPQPSNFYVEEVHAFEDGPKLLGTLPHLQPYPAALSSTLWVPESRSWVLSCQFVGETIGP